MSLIATPCFSDAQLQYRNPKCLKMLSPLGDMAVKSVHGVADFLVSARECLLHGFIKAVYGSIPTLMSLQRFGSKAKLGICSALMELFWMQHVVPHNRPSSYLFVYFADSRSCKGNGWSIKLKGPSGQ